jgi:hypothetical protein
VTGHSIGLASDNSKDHPVGHHAGPQPRYSGHDEEPMTTNRLSWKVALDIGLVVLFVIAIVAQHLAKF